MAYGYEARPTDYSFIATAGQQIGAGIVDAAKEKKAELEKIEAAKKVKLKNDELKAVHEKIMNQAAQEYMDATGETDPVKGYSFAAKFFYPPGTDEDSTVVQTRWINIGDKFNKALQEAKVQKYNELSKSTPATPEMPGAARTAAPIQDTRQMDIIATPENARSARLAGQSTGTSMMRGIAQMPGDEPQGLSEPPTPAMPEQTKSYQEKQAIANRLNIGEDKSVSKDLQSTQDLETGQNYAGGQNKAQYLAGMSARGIDVTTGAAKEIAGATPTEQQLLTNDRLSKQEEQRNRMRTALATMQEKRLRAQNMDKNTLKLLDTQIKAVQAQISASEATSKLALGIPTGKDYMGQTQYSTGPQWDKEYTDAETTLQSAQALLDKVDALNRQINPSPADKPVTLPSTMTASEQGAYQWLKNPASAKDPNYAAVRAKLATKYPDLVR